MINSEAATQDEAQSQYISQSYGQLFRAVWGQQAPHEADPALQSLAEGIQDNLQAALVEANTNGQDSLYRLAVASALATIRTTKQQRAEQAVTWLDLQNTSLPAQPERLAHIVQEALARLPAQRRRAMGLHLAGFTNTEIGELLGWSSNKTREQLERGGRVLRTALHAAEIEYEIDES